MGQAEDRLGRIAGLADAISRLAEQAARPVRLMEVCGTHSHAVGRHGLRQLLPDDVELVSGPGCPVCVTTAGQVELAVELARRGATVATFGDMMRVPGPSGSLADARAAGGDVRVVYSPRQALELAAREPAREVVLVAVGFETTAPAVAAVVKQALSEGLTGMSVLALHKLVPPALEALMADGEVGLDGLLCPGHVSVVIGSDAYRPVAERWRVPCVVAGFEPEDILLGVAMLLAQIAEGREEVENAYPRAVRPGGNARALALMDEVFEPTEGEWRGLGSLPASGLELRGAYATLDAQQRFGLEAVTVPDPPGCRCGDVLRGRLRPSQCGLFGGLCTPARPVGPCMVSSEGACAAAYRYERIEAVRG